MSPEHRQAAKPTAPAPAPADDADHRRLLGAAIVGNIKNGTELNHCASTWTSRQRLVLDSGRVSMMRTLSPILASFFSS